MASKKEDSKGAEGAPVVPEADAGPEDKPAASKSKGKPKKAGSRKPSGGSGKVPNIGIDVKLPEEVCTDRFCPFHGILPVRGQILEGYVVSDRMQGTAVVRREYMRHIPKYERLEKRSSKYLAHNPPCLGVAPGDRVKIMECRPLSKRVSFVIVEKMS